MTAAVSVIIPTFDRGHVVDEAVDSVLAQVHRDLEVIVIDDGSSDGTRELVASTFGADARVRYRYQSNRGAASARNAGLETTLARGAERITLSASMIVEARAYAHRWVGEAELQAGSHRFARTQLATALRLRPPRPWILVLLMITFLPRSAVIRIVRWRRRMRAWFGHGNVSTPKD
jgi:glycosyltransferase involved in cell wall biosynthesis